MLSNSNNFVLKVNGGSINKLKTKYKLATVSTTSVLGLTSISILNDYRRKSVIDNVNLAMNVQVLLNYPHLIQDLSILGKDLKKPLDVNALILSKVGLVKGVYLDDFNLEKLAGLFGKEKTSGSRWKTKG